MSTTDMAAFAIYGVIGTIGFFTYRSYFRSNKAIIKKNEYASLESKLDELENLKRKGKLTEDEYNKRRDFLLNSK